MWHVYSITGSEKYFANLRLIVLNQQRNINGYETSKKAFQF